MSEKNEVDLGRIALLEAIRNEERPGTYLRHVTALPIRIHRGKQVSSQCATALQLAGRFLHSTGAEPRMSLRSPFIAMFLRQSVSCSHLFISCSAAVWWPKAISPAACVPFDRGLKRLKAASEGMLKPLPLLPNAATTVLGARTRSPPWHALYPIFGPVRLSWMSSDIFRLESVSTGRTSAFDSTKRQRRSARTGFPDAERYRILSSRAVCFEYGEGRGHG